MYDIVFLNDIFIEESIGESKFLSSRLVDPSESMKWNFWSRYLGPYTVAESIKNHLPQYKVIVVDYFTKILNFFEYILSFVNKETQYICISTTFIQNSFNSRINDFNLWFKTHDELYNWFLELKKVAPNAKIIIGGHPVDSYFKQYVLNVNSTTLPPALNDFVNYAFHGYSEDMIVNFLNNKILPDHTYKKDNVIFYSDKTKAGVNAKVNLLNWSKLDAIQKDEWLPLEISKGCRFGCKFCMFDRHGTTIKEANVLRNELIRNYELFGIKGYHLTDDTVNDSPEKVDMIYNVVKSLPFNIEWVAYARPDMFYRYPEMLEKMINSGCKGMFLGIETFNKTAAKISGKGLDPEKIKDILKWIKDTAGNDIFILASFIIGLVGETEESLEDTLQWLLNQNVIDKITFDILYVRDPNYRTSNKKDFSQDAKEFGFKKIQFYPEYYWEHDTLNYKQCQQIAQRWKDLLPTAKYSGSDLARESVTNFWAYPRIRSLGYTHNQAFDILKTAKIPNELYDKNVQWINNYHKLLKENTNE
jgi:radical SAM superfamily enzyme YgiQ (UPF0313 family)